MNTVARAIDEVDSVVTDVQLLVQVARDIAANFPMADGDAAAEISRKASQLDALMTSILKRIDDVFTATEHVAACGRSA